MGLTMPRPGRCGRGALLIPQVRWPERRRGIWPARPDPAGLGRLRLLGTDRGPGLTDPVRRELAGARRRGEPRPFAKIAWTTVRLWTLSGHELEQRAVDLVGVGP